MALDIKLLIVIVAVCCPAGAGHATVARSCGREYAGTGGGRHGRGGELRGPGIDDDVAAELIARNMAEPLRTGRSLKRVRMALGLALQ